MDAGAELLFISIHALRKESDRAVVARPLPLGISIHALRKESDMTYESTAADIIFQSTLSVRRATRVRAMPPDGVWISIHALRKESDLWSWLWSP